MKLSASHVDRTARSSWNGATPLGEVIDERAGIDIDGGGIAEDCPAGAILRADGLIVDEGAARDVQGRTEAGLNCTSLGIEAECLVVHERARVDIGDAVDIEDGAAQLEAGRIRRRAGRVAGEDNMVDIHAVGSAARIDGASDAVRGLVVRQNIIRQRQCAGVVDRAPVAEAAEAAGGVTVGDGQPGDTERVGREARRGRISRREACSRTECL